MKKLLLFVAALFTTYFAQAQDGIKLGLKAGVNISNWNGDDADGTESLFGIHLGGFLDYGVTEMVSVRPELVYSMKGISEDDSDVDVKLRSHYIDIPVLARIRPASSGLFFEVGPTFSFLLSAKASAGDQSETVTDGFKKFDVGYAAGLGYELETGLGFGLRYNGGISRIDEEGDAKAHNSVFQLSVTYNLRDL